MPALPALPPGHRLPPRAALRRWRPRWWLSTDALVGDDALTLAMDILGSGPARQAALLPLAQRRLRHLHWRIKLQPLAPLRVPLVCAAVVAPVVHSVPGVRWLAWAGMTLVMASGAWLAHDVTLDSTITLRARHRARAAQALAMWRGITQVCQDAAACRARQATLFVRP